MEPLPVSIKLVVPLKAFNDNLGVYDIPKGGALCISFKAEEGERYVLEMEAYKSNNRRQMAVSRVAGRYTNSMPYIPSTMRWGPQKTGKVQVQEKETATAVGAEDGDMIYTYIWDAGLKADQVKFHVKTIAT